MSRGEREGGLPPKALLGLLLFGLLLAWWNWPRAIEHLGFRSGPIVVLGDSLSAGFGSETHSGYVAILQRRLGLELVNRGVTGDTTAAALARLDRDVLSMEPALVIVQLGGNDFLQKVPPEQTFANLDRIVGRIYDRGCPVLLLGVRGGLFSDRAAGSYRRLADRRHTGFVPDVLEDVLTHPDLKFDAIHPNDRGYQLVADRVEPELRRMVRGIGRTPSSGK